MIAEVAGKSPRGAVAATWHLVALLIALLATSLWGALQNPITKWASELAAPGARLALYAKILALQWAWAAFVWWGIRRGGGSIRGVVDEARWSAPRWLRYALVGAAGLVLWLALGGGLGAVLRPSPEQLRGLQALLPHTRAERALWIGFALSASLCEELVYRGYLMRQFRALTGSTLAAVALQATCYASAHLALPAPMVASVGVLGLLLGLVAAWQRSLVPGMLLHASNGLLALVGTGG